MLKCMKWWWWALAHSNTHTHRDRVGQVWQAEKRLYGFLLPLLTQWCTCAPHQMIRVMMWGSSTNHTSAPKLSEVQVLLQQNWTRISSEQQMHWRISLASSLNWTGTEMQMCLSVWGERSNDPLFSATFSVSIRPIDWEIQGGKESCVHDLQQQQQQQRRSRTTH